MAQHQNTTKIIRSVNSSKHNFTPISNQLIQNQTLSLEAKGLVIFILSLPETWIIYKGQVQTALGMNKTKFNRIWKECVDSGYIQCIKERIDRGRFNYHYVITDLLSDDGFTAGGKSVGGESVGGKPVSKEKKEEEKINKEKNIQEKISITQVSTRKTFAEIFNNNLSSEDALKYINS